MTTAVVHRRPLMPTFTLLLAGGAAVLGVIAIAADDAGTITPAPEPPVATAPAPNARSTPAAPGFVNEFDTCGDRLLPNGPC